MATLLWGKVYYRDIFAGILRQESGDRTQFEYDSAYLSGRHPSISYTMPTTSTTHTDQGLLPFFDNLIAEGWLENAQTRLLGKREKQISRFELLLAFGYDCAGAVSIIDPETTPLTQLLLDMNDPKEMAVYLGRASLSGVQAKISIVECNGKYFPSKTNELSTHIAKFPSPIHPDLLDNEYLTSQAFKALLSDDEVVDLSMNTIEGIAEPALLIKRFDRSQTEKVKMERVHFEEFSQLLKLKSRDKYNGDYKAMSNFILSSKDCLPIENYRLFARILAGLLLGNTDMHFKNFAMFHTTTGLRLTPSYDQVSSSLYKYKAIALAIDRTRDRLISKLRPKHLIAMAQDFGLPNPAIEMVYKQLKHNKDAAKEAIASARHGQANFKNELIKLIDARWNGTFDLIGRALLMKQ